jgi:YVTN family beta-propeller protein
MITTRRHSFSAMRSALLATLCGSLPWLACTSTTEPGQVASLLVTPDAVQLTRLDSLQLSVSALNGDDQLVTGVAVSFASSDTTIVTVSNLGVVKAVGPLGSTSVRVRGGGAHKDVPVTVHAVPSGVRIAPRDTSILQGGSVQMAATVTDEHNLPIPGLAVEFASSDTTIATVSASGLVRSQGRAGQVWVYAEHEPFYDAARVVVRDSSLGARVSLGGRPYGAAISPAGVAYVTQLDLAQLSRADLPSRSFESTVAVGVVPSEVAFNSTGTRAYVTNQFSHNLGVVNVATNTQIDTITVTGDPFEVIVAPGDSILYVSTNVNSVYGIRLSTKAVVAEFPTPAIANGFAIRHDTLLYASTHEGGTIIEFNLRTRAVARTFTVGGTPQKLALSADGNELYIANQAGYVQFWDLVGGTQIGGNLALPGSAGYGMARRASTGQLYVTSAYFGAGNIHVVNPVTRTLVKTIVAGGSTRHVVFNASGTIGLVPNEGGWVDFLK